jgi:hypothetical protein
MDPKVEKRETSQWLMLSLELWLIISLGLAVGVAGTFLYWRVVSLEQRVATLESVGGAASPSASH